MLGLEPFVHAYVRWAMSQHGRLDRSTLAAIWPVVVGRVWAERTHPKALRGGALEVAVPDSVWQSELRFQAETILNKLNRVLPSDAPRIESLSVSVGSGVGWRPTKLDAAPAEEVSIPLTAEQSDALMQIADPELRAVVARVIERDAGRLEGEQET